MSITEGKTRKKVKLKKIITSTKNDEPEQPVVPKKEDVNQRVVK